jgi:hypothetical protein
MGFEDSATVTIYPDSGLISADNQKLFACRTPLYPVRLIADTGDRTEKQVWHQVLSSATHVGLCKEDNESMIFFTMFGDSFESNENQPFGLWAMLRPIPYQTRIIRPIHVIIAKKRQQKALAWAAAGHQRLGDQIENTALRTVAENSDLMRMIISTVLTGY